MPYDKTHPFIRKGRDFSTFVDGAFGQMLACRKDMQLHPDLTINATAGSLCGPDGKVTAYKTVYKVFDSIDPSVKASYASAVEGPEDYRNAVFNWLNRLGNIKLAHRVVASAGGTGAVALSAFNCSCPGEDILLPDMGWINYRIMAQECDCGFVTYDLMEGVELSLKDLKEKSRMLMEKQGRLVVIINDPCENPTGATYGVERWTELVAFYNELSKKGPVVIINDIAYLDYDFDCDNATAYLGCFNDISENVAVMLCFSCSKLLTAYGMRLGALVALAQKDEDAEALSSTCIRYGRTNWGNTNNGLMACFVEIMKNHKEELLAEKRQAIESLKARSEAFVSGCREHGVEIFPYLGGFFITVRVEDPALLDRVTDKLIEDHIYTVKYPKGIRFAICSMSLEDCKVAPARIRKAFDKALAEMK